MICVDCRSVYAYPSGLLAYQRALARYLPPLDTNQHFQLLRHMDAPGRLALHPNVHEVFVQGDPEHATAPLRLRYSFNKSGVSLFHATGGFLPVGLGVPAISTIHDLLWLSNPEWLRQPRLSGQISATLCQQLQQYTLRHSDRLIVPSEATRRAVEELAPYAASKVRVIPHGVEDSFHPVDPADESANRHIRERCARLLPGAKRFIIDVGRAAAFRNHMGLLRAFADSFRSEENLHLALIQAMSDQTPSLIRAAAKLGVEGRVHILSGLSSDDLRCLYQSAVCLCHPSLHEPFGTVVAEAMACGCPVITSRRSAAGEIAEGVALFVNPERDDEIAGALKRIVAEPELAPRLREKGLERARALSDESCVNATFQVYQELLSD